MNIRRWVALVNVRYFELVGHIGRLIALDPTRLTATVLRWNDIESLERRAALTGSQGHTQRLRVWRWEQPIINIFKSLGLRWQNVCLDRVWWASLKEQCVQQFRCR